MARTHPAPWASSLIVFSIWLLAYSLIALAYPYQQGFDDFDHLPASIQWGQELTLTSDGLFLRVPFWQMLLGTSMRLSGSVDVGLFVVQSSIIFAAIVCYFLYCRRFPKASLFVLFAPVLLFSLSPQALLYARHAVNEPFIGLLAVMTMVLGTSKLKYRFLAMGVIGGVATMTKIIAVSLCIPALGTLASAPAWRRNLLQYGAAALLIVVPILLLHQIQRGPALIDTTGAYNLSEFSPEQWRQLGDHMQRYETAMAIWKDHFLGDPAGYLAGFVGRLGSWLIRPGSADFAYFYDQYPMQLIVVWDQVVLLALLALGLLGTQKRDLPTWAFMLVIVVGCTFPLKTPFSPKVILIYPLLMMAPRGLIRLRASRT